MDQEVRELERRLRVDSVSMEEADAVRARAGCGVAARRQASRARVRDLGSDQALAWAYTAVPAGFVFPTTADGRTMTSIPAEVAEAEGLDTFTMVNALLDRVAREQPVEKALCVMLREEFLPRAQLKRLPWGARKRVRAVADEVISLARRIYAVDLPPAAAERRRAEVET